MNDTAIVIIYYKNFDHFFECLESIIDTPGCDFYVIENKSDVDVSERIKKYVDEGKIKKYAFFEKNIANNAPRIFMSDGNVNFDDYKYLVFTDGDVVPDKGWLDENKYILDHNKEVFVISTSLYMDNLPVKNFPEAINWVPRNAIDRGDYLETITGCYFLTFRAEEYKKYVDFVLLKPYKIKGIPYVDWHIHNFAKSINKKSGRTKNTKAKHLTWDYYQDLNHPYTKEKMLPPPWNDKDSCKYTIYPEQNNPVVTVACVTYNHVKFIRQAIDSFLMQKTTFPFEIIIHDDASTDGTVDIIKKYAKKYPDVIKIILQKKNQYEQGMRSGVLFGYDPLVRHVLPIAKGKYIALCEGDDYWTDPMKLQKQVNHLDIHPEQVMCYHYCAWVNDDSNICFPYGKGEQGIDYTKIKLVAAPGGIATSTKMFRNIYNEETKEDFINFSGDFLFNSFMGTKGECGFIKGMDPSIYRIHSGGVWTGMSVVTKHLVIKRLYNRMYELHLQKGNPIYTKIVKRHCNYKHTFGIIIPTFQRIDGKTPFYLQRVLKSIYSQTHKDFRIYVIGDRYENEKEFLSMVKNYPIENMYYTNLSKAHERDKYTNNKEALWCSGGVFATNYGIKKAIEDNLQYVCLLDHDDYWLPDHLELLNKTILEKEADWICTKTSVGRNRFLPVNVGNNDKEIKFLPLPCGIIKSSVCYNIKKIPLFVRDVFEETEVACPADADLWRRSADYIKKNNLISYYINKHTCVHDEEGYIRHGGRGSSNENGVTVITCTGDRPKSFDLLQRWMNNQITKPQQWIVIDDGKVPIVPSKNFEYYRREPSESDYTHTLCLNLMKALQHVKNNKIIIMEDDDWYSPTYIDYMNDLLGKADLVGLGNLVFYYPEISSFMEKKTLKQPAFAQTAFHKNIIPILNTICESASKEYELCGKGLIDVYLWKNSLNIYKEELSIQLTNSLKIASGKILPVGTIFKDPIPLGILKRAERKQGAIFIKERKSMVAKKLIVQCDKYISVGMKGMPGRKGLTTHHNIDNKKYKKDVDNKMLKSILEKDAKYYLGYFPLTNV